MIEDNIERFLSMNRCDCENQIVTVEEGEICVK